MTESIFRDFCPPPFVTITCPQFPVSRDIDSSDPQDDGRSDEDWDDGEDLEAGVDEEMRYGAPSPEIFTGSRQDLPQTPPNPNPISPPRVPHTSYKKRSTRIPDFVQLIYKLTVGVDDKIDYPPNYTRRIILLVEIKRNSVSVQPWSFSEVFPQTDRQARRAFVASPSTNTLGLIVALGDCWTYREYTRDKVKASPSRSEQEDPTFALSTPLVSSISQLFSPLNQFFGTEGYARLQSANSDSALRVVRKRLQELCRDM